MNDKYHPKRGFSNWDIRDRELGYLGQRKINDNNEDNQMIYLDLAKLGTHLRNLSILIHKHK